jgi:hypothetical protein
MTHFQTSNSILMIKENISNATTNNNQDELGMVRTSEIESPL